MSSRPEPVLLDNGDVLAPVPHDDGSGWAMVRVPVGDSEHAEWIALVQGGRSQFDSLVMWGFITAILLPVIGLALAIVLFVQERVGQGLAVLATAFVSMFVFGYVLLGAG